LREAQSATKQSSWGLLRLLRRLAMTEEDDIIYAMAGENNINELHKADSTQDWETQDNVKPLGSDSASKSEFESLYEELKTKFDELDDQYKRLWADQQNMVSRFNREKADIQKYAAVSTLEAILPALDNFDFAIKSLNENTKFEEVIKSIGMLQEQLIMCLRAVGLEEIDTNCLYNAQLHEAISNQVDAEKPEGTILQVLKKGFKLKDRVIRPALVVVSTKN
jgi:molecular chaperone GrpE